MTSNANYINNNILKVYTNTALPEFPLYHFVYYQFIMKIFVLNTSLNARKTTEYLKYLENVQLCHHLYHADNSTLLIA